MNAGLLVLTHPFEFSLDVSTEFSEFSNKKLSLQSKGSNLPPFALETKVLPQRQYDTC